MLFTRHRLAVATALAGARAGYLLVVRPWQLRWGASDDEVARGMPGDEVVARPTFVATRAVTIEAPPEAIWPWLVQTGFGRAGWYSYDWIDNLGRPSAERIIPQLQHIAVGSYIPLGPGDNSGFWVRAFLADRWMLWADKKGGVTWFWGLYPVDGRRTRRITRVRLRYDWLSPWIVFNLALDVGDIVMMRQCLLGIKWRATMPALRT